MTASRTPARVLFAITVVALLGGVIFSVVKSAEDERAASPSGPAAPCPYGFVDQPARGAGLIHGLRTTDDGARLVTALGAREVRYCFGETDHGLVTEERVLLLSRDAPELENAARVAHLLHHVVEGSPYPSSVPRGADCDAIVERAIEREAAAYAIEVRVRRALGEERPRYEFERAFFAAPEADRERVVADYLRAHPDGAPNLDGLVAGYRARCSRSRSR